MGQAEIIIDMVQHQLLAQAVLVFAQCGNAPSNSGHMLAHRQVDAVTVDGGIAPSTPGSRAGLLPPSPLRTARASFPACRSSLSNARGRARLCYVQRLAMDLPMTGGM